MAQWKIVRLVSAVLASGVFALANAQTFPARAVTIVVPFDTGGSTDVMMRIIGRKYSEIVGQPVVIENRGGGSGAVGAVAVKNAVPDGYTLLAANPPILVVNPILTPNLPYDSVKDFTPVQLTYKTVTFLYVPASSPANSMSELIALARKTSGGLSYASQGMGTSGHLGGAMLQALTGAPFVHVPYKGSGPGMLDLAAGRVDLFFSVRATAAPFVKAETVKILAVAAETRSKVFPDVPTTAESGFPSIVLDTWFGLYAPAGTPQSVIMKLNEDIKKAVLSPEVTKRITDQSLEPLSATPSEIGALLVADKARYEKVSMHLGVRAE